MRYLTLGEVIELHGRVLQVGGGAPGIRDLGGLDSALAQPRATFGDVDLYPTLAEKVLILNSADSLPAHIQTSSFRCSRDAQACAGSRQLFGKLLEVRVHDIDALAVHLMRPVHVPDDIAGEAYLL